MENKEAYKENSAKKHGFLWWSGRILLWIVFFPIMLIVFLIRSKKLPTAVKVPLVFLYTGLFGVAVIAGYSIDREAPVIKAKEITADYGTAIDVAEIASIVDSKDENPSIAITYCDPKVGIIGQDGQNVSFSKVGNYTVKVTGEDSSGNVAEAEIPVIIKDGTPPTIKTLKSNFPVLDNIAVGDIAAAKDEVDASPDLTIIACDGTAEIAKGGKSIVFKKPGDYSVGLMAIDASENEIKEKVSVKIVNTSVPEIKLSEKEITISDSDKEVDYGKYVSAESAVYGDLSKDVAIDSSAVQYGKPGKYNVSYTITDKDGNQNKTGLSVVIKDTTAPVIAAFTTEFVLTAGDSKPDYMSGFTAKDSYEGDLTGKITVDDSAVDYNTAGTYIITYLVADGAGNTTKKEATVTVKEKETERAVAPESGAGIAAAEVQQEETNVDTGGNPNYILNTNTGKFHYPYCSSVDDMKESNKEYFYGTREEAVDRGYDPCKRCNP